MIKLIVGFYALNFLIGAVFIGFKIKERLREKKEEAQKDYHEY